MIRTNIKPASVVVGPRASAPFESVAASPSPPALFDVSRDVPDEGRRVHRGHPSTEPVYLEVIHSALENNTHLSISQNYV